MLRYACRRQYGPDITDADRAFMQSVTEIFGALVNVERCKPVVERGDRLDLEIQRFRDHGQLDKFVQFIANSTRSKISSLYIKLSIRHSDQSKQSKQSDQATILRLFDAYGLQGEVASYRNSQPPLQDYSDARTGLTWKLFQQDRYGKHSDRPTVTASVADVDGWKGQNTVIFYAEHFRRLGITLRNGDEVGFSRHVELGDYAIPLMGRCLYSRSNDPIGVLKVEFVESSNPAYCYDQNDEEFFKKCTDVLAEELEQYVDFLSGKWFRTATADNAAIFVRMFMQVLRTKVISEKECVLEFWEPAKKYVNEHQISVDVAIENFVKKLDQQKIREIKKKLAEFGEHTVVAILAKYFVDVLM